MQKFFTSEKKNFASLVAEIGELCDGLFYISETDAEVTAFSAQATGELTAESIAAAAGIEIGSEHEVRSAAEFFERLTKEKEWFGDAEKEKAKRFGKLYELLNESLRDLKVYRFGTVRVDIIVAGVDGEGNAAGIRTFAVET